MYSKKTKNLPEEYLDAIFTTVEQKLIDGCSNEVEKLLIEIIESYTHKPDNFAELKRLLSYTLETLGRYKDSLDVIVLFENDEELIKISPESQIKITTQLATCYGNLSDNPKAATLLKRTLRQAQEKDLEHLFGVIYIALARVYRKLCEFPISRDHAEKALSNFRDRGDWRGMAESYQMIATSYYQEGNNFKSLEYFELAVKIVGERSAPFLLGKIYSEMSGAYYVLNRPQEGIACLEKSIKFFEQTEHKLNSVMAYNNLGMNLLVLGDWTRAEAMMKRALDLAVEANHVHIAGILDSIGELKLLRGELDESKDLLERGIKFAVERRKEWYAIHAMRNLARCFLAQGKISESVATAQETVDKCLNMGEKQTVNLARLVLAESLLENGDFIRYENVLETIEDSVLPTEFFILGGIQRIRGLAALKDDDKELGVHHFSRSLTIFESANDIYHTALAHYQIGVNLPFNQHARAVKHLNSAVQIFLKLGVRHYHELAKNAVETIKNQTIAAEPTTEKTRSVSAVSQLLTVRLAEATASRELLFRELAAVLQQESMAKKIIIAEPNENKTLYPFITHNFTAGESTNLVAKLHEAQQKNAVKSFSQTKNLAVFHLRPSSAAHAFLLISPQNGANLNDETSIQPLLRVVELGMDVISLREKDKTQTDEHELSQHISQSLMPGFIHSSPGMSSLVEEVYKIRSSDVTVLVTGESGTGKELVSRAIHVVSNRKDKVFVPFNCTAVPKELAEGHLFGYRKGAFTGAVNDSPGMIRAADGGTLFLDEVGDLPIDIQPKLLRFLQEGEVQPIGEKRPIKVDVRVIAATNMPLEEKVANGTFREDLYYRLNVIRLRVPPLRERRSEIPPIINYYINHYSARFNKRNLTVTPQTIDLLMVCEWAGNVRQLCNEIQRIVARAEDGDVITPEQLSPELKRSGKPQIPFGIGNIKQFIDSKTAKPSNFAVSSQSKRIQMPAYSSAPMPEYNISEFVTKGTLESAVAELETMMISDSLYRHEGNISRVARELGLTRRGLYMKIARYGIEKAA